MGLRLRMGTRGSALALAQSGQVAAALKKSHSDLEVETVVIKTSGDLFGSVTPQKARELAAGTKGLFVKEIEEALAAETIDFAVHSAKDLPAELAPGLFIAAYPEREDPRDVFIGREGLRLSGLKAGHRVATSSLRRKIQLLAAKPGVVIEPLRGNVDTRLKRLAEGRFDALIVAGAGLKRLGRADVSHEAIPEDLMIPAPGQGALAVEVKASRSDVAGLVAALDHPRTRLEVELERAVLAAAGGGCSTPLGVRARGTTVNAFWAREDGTGARRLQQDCRDAAEAAAFGSALAER